MEMTLSIIKPDGVQRNLIGEIYRRFEANGLKIVAARMLWMSPVEARVFYAVHKDRPFYDSLVDYMISGPVMVQVLAGQDAIRRHREIMGATDPAKADIGTIRADFAETVERNTVHGSDGPDTAANEIAFFFARSEILELS